MATTNTLRVSFYNADGKKVSQSFSPADASVSGATVKTLMNTMIEKADDLYQEQLTSIAGAAIVARTETEITIPA